MRALPIAIFVALTVPAAVAAQSPNADVTAPIHKFIDSFDKGDMAAAAATHAAGADLAIVDELPPFSWTGANAFQEWSSALGEDVKKNGMTGAKVTVGAPTRVERTDDRAYVVVPAVFSFTQNGKAMREAAQMTFVLQKDASGWLIHAWTWTGPRPKPAAAPRKK